MQLHVRLLFCLQPPPELKGQPASQDGPSVSPTTAGSVFADSMEVASADAGMKEAEEFKSDVAADVTVSPKGSENVKEEPSPPPATSADKQTVATTPVRLENAAEFPPINEDVFKALTSALQKHRLAKENGTKSDDKEVP